MNHANKVEKSGIFTCCLLLGLELFSCSSVEKNPNNRLAEEMNGSILAAKAELLTRAQAKITYLGEQSKPIPTVVFSSQGFTVELDKFLKVQGTPTLYGNDRLPYTQSFTVSAPEFHRILLSVKPILEALDSSQKHEFLSFTVTCSTDSGLIGQEYRLNHGQGAGFYTDLIEALDADNVQGREIISKQYRNIYPDIE